MSPLQRFVFLVGLPAFTLLLGVQLGFRLSENTRPSVTISMPPNSVASASGKVLTNPRKQADIDLVWDVWEVLLSRYIAPEELVDDKMILGAAQGLVDSVGDPYTVFMSPKENTDFRQALQGELQGIGAELSQREESVVIVAPLKGSPAQKAGIMPEDVIISINEEDATGLSLQEVVKRVRGPKGTKVTLGLLRESKVVTISVIRDDIHVPSTESSVKKTAKGNIGYLAINQFGDSTIAEATGNLRELMKEDLKGLILDLRFNGGGYLDGADDLTSLFLKEGIIVSVAGRDGPPQVHRVSGKTLLPDIPMVVLINQGSASASEIVAGALRDHKRATVIGMKSFGKGTVQEVVDLPGGSSLRVTIAKWLTPAGHNIGKEGIHPDIVVDRTTEQFNNNEDPQLEAALQFLTDGKVTVKTGTGS